MNLQDLMAGTMFAPGGGSASLTANLLSGGNPRAGITGFLNQAGNPGAMATQMLPPRTDDPSASWEPGGQYPGAIPHIPMQPMPGMDAAAQVKKPGLFGHGGTGWGIVGILGDALSAAGGGPARFTEMVAKQRQDEADQRARLQEWQAQHEEQKQRQQVVNLGDGGVGTFSQDGGLNILREPVPADRTPNAVQVLKAAGIDPTSPEGRDALMRSLSGFQYSQPGIQAIGQAADARAGAVAAHRAPPRGGGGGAPQFEYRMGPNGQLQKRRVQ